MSHIMIIWEKVVVKKLGEETEVSEGKLERRIEVLKINRLKINSAKAKFFEFGFGRYVMAMGSSEARRSIVK